MINCRPTVLCFVLITTFGCGFVNCYSRGKRSESFEISASHGEDEVPRWSANLPDISEEEYQDIQKAQPINKVRQLFLESRSPIHKAT